MYLPKLKPNQTFDPYCMLNVLTALMNATISAITVDTETPSEKKNRATIESLRTYSPPFTLARSTL